MTAVPVVMSGGRSGAARTGEAMGAVAERAA